ncbi:MAG TPA: hypothetical protein VF727_00635 [Allosphingosinicella sp.]|jgi:hypothetical protein
MAARGSFDARRRFRVAMALFIVGLIASGLTAFPLLWEMKVLTRLFGLADATSAAGHEGLAHWLLTVRFGLEEVYSRHPWVAYGTDWLAFAHLAIALFFIGPLSDPASSRPNLYAGLAACAGIIPLALIAGAVREVPLASRLIDCSFGVFGGALLLYCLRLLPRIEARP